MASSFCLYPSYSITAIVISPCRFFISRKIVSYRQDKRKNNSPFHAKFARPAGKAVPGFYPNAKFGDKNKKATRSRVVPSDGNTAQRSLTICRMSPKIMSSTSYAMKFSIIVVLTLLSFFRFHHYCTIGTFAKQASDFTVLSKKFTQNSCRIDKQPLQTEAYDPIIINN